MGQIWSDALTECAAGWQRWRRRPGQRCLGSLPENPGPASVALCWPWWWVRSRAPTWTLRVISPFVQPNGEPISKVGSTRLLDITDHRDVTGTSFPGWNGRSLTLPVWGMLSPLTSWLCSFCLSEEEKLCIYDRSALIPQKAAIWPVEIYMFMMSYTSRGSECHHQLTIFWEKALKNRMAKKELLESFSSLN